jgi:hypothetical protein
MPILIAAEGLAFSAYVSLACSEILRAELCVSECKSPE